MSAERLLLTFQESHQHLGGRGRRVRRRSGILTLEDVLEELVGELQDEFDEETPDFLPLRRGGFLVSAGMLLEAVTARLGVTLDEEIEADTLGGYVQQQLGRLGKVGDESASGPTPCGSSRRGAGGCSSCSSSPGPAAGGAPRGG